MGFMSIYDKIKEGKKKRSTQSAQTTNKKYNISLSVDIPYNKSTFSQAMAARDEISEAWSKIGKWVGQGTDLGSPGECDVQVEFRGRDYNKATEISDKILKKHKVTGRYTTFKVEE